MQDSLKIAYARRAEQAADYLPESSTRRPIIRLANSYLEDQDDETYTRLNTLIEEAIVRYPEFARAMGRHRNRMTSAEVERMLPNWYWAPHRARLTSGL